MKRAAIYARVSTDEQRSNYSIPTQISSCIEHAEQRGYAIVGDQYVDPERGLDQTTPEGNIRAYVDDFSSLELIRPSLDAAYQYLITSGYDILIVHALDRLARDPYHRRTLEIKFEGVGSLIEYVLGDYDDSAEGEVRKDMDATFAKWENAKRVERSMRGMRAKAKSGLFVAGVAPFGYSIDPESFGGLAVNEEQAEVVRHIFELYVHDGLSIRGIAAQLEIEELENHSGNVSWGKTTIAKTLSNTTYVGRCYYNKWETQRRTKKLELRDKDDWIEIPTTPIVDESLFRAAQERLAHNRRVRRRKAEAAISLYAQLAKDTENMLGYDDDFTMAEQGIAGHDGTGTSVTNLLYGRNEKGTIIQRTVFLRCNSVTSVSLIVDSPDDTAKKYAQRLDDRLVDLVCPNISREEN